MNLMSVADFKAVLAGTSFLPADYQERTLRPQGVCWFGDGVLSTEEEECYKVFEKATGFVVTDSEPITYTPATVSDTKAIADILSRTWMNSTIVSDNQDFDDFGYRRGSEWKISHLQEKDFGNGKTFHTIDSVSRNILLAFTGDQEEVASIFDAAGMLEWVDCLFDMETAMEMDDEEAPMKFSVLTGQTREELREEVIAFMQGASCPQGLYAVGHHKIGKLLRLVIFTLARDGKQCETPECEYAFKDILLNPKEQNGLQVCLLWRD